MEPILSQVDDTDQKPQHTPFTVDSAQPISDDESGAGCCRLLSLAKPQCRILTAAAAFQMVQVCADLVPSILFGCLIDVVSHSSKPWLLSMLCDMINNPCTDNRAQILIIMGAYMAVGIISSIATFFASFLKRIAAARLLQDLRMRLFQAIADQECGFFDQTSTGELANRLASDTTAVGDLITYDLTNRFGSVINVAFSITYMLILSPKLTLVTFSTFPLIGILAKKFGDCFADISEKTQLALAIASETAIETVMNIRNVKAASLEPRQVERYEARVHESTRQSIKMARARGFQRSLTVLLEAMGTTVLLYVSGHQVLDGVLTAGELSTFFMLANQVMSQSKDLLALYAQFQGAIGATRRVFQLVQRQPQLEDGTCTPQIDGHFRFEKVFLRYGSADQEPRDALQDVTISFLPGTVTALVGSSGGGKSSIASLLLRLYDPTQGRVILDGRLLTSYKLDWLHAHIALVAQEPMLFAGSIRDNIAQCCARPPSDLQIEAAAKIANAHEFIMGLPDGYDTQCGERGCCLSGGQRQRLAIAVAVVRDPKILVLDEATSALDSVSEALVKSALDRVMPGRTSIMIAHRLSTVRLSDNIVVMEKGRVVEQGSHEQLLELPNGRYKVLLAAQYEND